nr:MAG TPA: Sigma-70, region 4 [Caudoviricetes sp.]
MSASKWLTDRERRVFSLYYQRGWAIEDVAAELDVSRGTVNNDLRSIRGKV